MDYHKFANEDSSDNSDYEGKVNPTFAYREASSNENVTPPELKPPMDISSELDVHANRSPLYINHVSAASTDDEPPLATSSGQQSLYALANEGTQLKQNNTLPEDRTVYSSCNDVTLTKENMNNIKEVLQNPNEYEKGGYVQPVAMFNPVRTEESNSIGDRDTKDNLYTQSAKKPNVKQDEQPIIASHRDSQNDENGYISPTDATISYDLGNGDLITDTSNSNPYTGTPKAKRREFQRFDSGVGGCDLGKDTLEAPTEFRDRLSTSVEEHYEDIDVYTNERKLEKIRKKVSTQRTPKDENTEPMKIQTVPPTTTERVKRPSVEKQNSLPVAQPPSSPSCDKPKATHRRAPTSSSRNAYTHIEIETPTSPIDPDNKRDKMKKERGRGYCILVAALITLFFLVAVSLGISVSILTMRLLDSKDGHSKQVQGSDLTGYTVMTNNGGGPPIQWPARIVAIDDSLLELKSEIRTLNKQNVALKKKIKEQNNETEVKLNQLLMAKQENMSSEIASMSSKFDSKIDNITSFISSQGIKGLSTCNIQSSTYTKFTSGGIHVETAFKPSKDEIEDHFVLFAFCTYIGMADVNLDVQEQNSRVQYRCRCKADKKALAYKACTLYYWLCPRS